MPAEEEQGIQIIVPIRDFDSDSQCPKCDTKRDEETHKEGPGVHVEWLITDGCSLSVNSVTVDIPEGFEVMKNRCNRCGFEWLMQTSDAAERAEAAKKIAEEAAEQEEKKKEEAEGPPVRFRGHASRSSKK